MSKNVRLGIFETNSSSVNTLSLFKKSDWENFNQGKLVLKIEPNSIKDEPDITLVDVENYNDANEKEKYKYYYDYKKLISCYPIIKELDDVIGVLIETYNW